MEEGYDDDDDDADAAVRPRLGVEDGQITASPWVSITTRRARDVMKFSPAGGRKVWGGGGGGEMKIEAAKRGRVKRTEGR